MVKVVGTTYLDIVCGAVTRSDPMEFLFFQSGRRDQHHCFSHAARAIQRFGRAEAADLSITPQPTLIANGGHDRVVPSILSEDLHRRIAGSELVVYPNSGHGGMFQYWDQFAPLAARFLTDAADPDSTS